LGDPEVEAAAVKIQASFRKHISKQNTDGKEGSNEEGPGTSGASGLADKTTEAQNDANKANGNGEEEEVDIDLKDPEVADAAAKIQAGFKKHMLKKKKSEPNTK